MDQAQKHSQDAFNDVNSNENDSLYATTLPSVFTISQQVSQQQQPNYQLQAPINNLNDYQQSQNHFLPQANVHNRQQAYIQVVPKENFHAILQAQPQNNQLSQQPARRVPDQPAQQPQQQRSPLDLTPNPSNKQKDISAVAGWNRPTNFQSIGQKEQQIQQHSQFQYQQQQQQLLLQQQFQYQYFPQNMIQFQQKQQDHQPQSSQYYLAQQQQQNQLQDMYQQAQLNQPYQQQVFSQQQSPQIEKNQSLSLDQQNLVDTELKLFVPENQEQESRQSLYQQSQKQEELLSNQYNYFYQPHRGTDCPTPITPLIDIISAPTQNIPGSSLCKQSISLPDHQKETVVLMRENQSENLFNDASSKNNKNNNFSVQKIKPFGFQTLQNSDENNLDSQNYFFSQSKNNSKTWKDEEKEEEEAKPPVQNFDCNYDQTIPFSLKKNDQILSQAADNQQQIIQNKGNTQGNEYEQLINDISDWWQKQSELPPIFEICQKILRFNQKMTSPEEKWIQVVFKQQSKLIEEISRYQKIESYPENIVEIMESLAKIFSIIFLGQSGFEDLEKKFNKYQEICIDLLEKHHKFMLFEVKLKLDEEFKDYSNQSKKKKYNPFQKNTESQSQTEKNKDKAKGEIKDQEVQKYQRDKFQQQQNLNSFNFQNNRPSREDQQSREVSRERTLKQNNYQPFNEDLEKQCTIKKQPMLNVQEIQQNKNKQYLDNCIIRKKELSSAAYLKNQYYFLREDFNLKISELLHPLLNKPYKVYVQKFDRNIRNEMNIYFNLKITNFNFDEKNLVMCLKGCPIFTSERVKFSEQNRLKQGQLIILADTRFRKIFMGTVHYVDSQADQTFQNSHQVQFGIVPYLKRNDDLSSILEKVIDLAKKSQQEGLYGFEPKSFWGAYSNCLQEIQIMAERKDNLPFNRLILSSSQMDIKPTSVYPKKFMKLSDNYYSLQPSEKKAFESLLNQNVCLVSSPQKLSKSNLVSSFVETLLYNWGQWNPNNRPILVVSKKAETVEQFVTKLGWYQQGNFEEQFLRLSNQTFKKYYQLFDLSQKEIESQRTKAKQAFLNYINPISEIENHMEAEVMSFQLSSVYILNKLINDLFEFLHIRPFPVNSIPKEDRLLIFKKWWSRSINEDMFDNIICKEIRQAGQTEQGKISIKGYQTKVKADFKEFQKKINKKKYYDHSKNYPKYQLKAGYTSDEEVIKKNEGEGTIKTKDLQKKIKKIDFWGNNKEFFDENIKLNFDLKSKNLLNLSYSELEQIKNKLCLQKQKELMPVFQKYVNDFQQAAANLSQNMMQVELEIVKTKMIIGGTVIDAHNYIETLKKSEYETLIVLDEAEQIQEGMLVPLLREGLKQLILIGDADAEVDPISLINNPELESTYNYGRSLFRRLKDNNMSYEKLQVENNSFYQEQYLPNKLSANKFVSNQNNYENINYNNNNNNNNNNMRNNPLRPEERSNRDERGLPQPIRQNPFLKSNKSVQNTIQKFY